MFETKMIRKKFSFMRKANKMITIKISLVPMDHKSVTVLHLHKVSTK